MSLVFTTKTVPSENVFLIFVPLKPYGLIWLVLIIKITITQNAAEETVRINQDILLRFLFILLYTLIEDFDFSQFVSVL